MKTAYDWVTVLIFAALVTRFLQQSVKPNDDDHSIWHYFVASVGCGSANWLGNNGWHWSAVAAIGATLAYIVVFLSPFVRPRP